MKVIELLEGVDVATTEAPEEILVFADGCLVGQATAAYPGPWGWVRGRKAGANNAVVVAVAADVRISRVPAGSAYNRSGLALDECDALARGLLPKGWVELTLPDAPQENATTAKASEEWKRRNREYANAGPEARKEQLVALIEAGIVCTLCLRSLGSAGPARRNGRRERHCARCRSIVHARHRPDAPEARDELRRDAALRSVFGEEVPPKTRTEPDIFPAPTPHHHTAADVRITAQMSPLAQHLFVLLNSSMLVGAQDVPAGPRTLLCASPPYPRPGTYGDKS